MESYEKITRDLCAFIASSPTCFHVTANAAALLKEHGFEELSETEEWDLKPGHAYYVIRGGSCLAAFLIPGKRVSDYQIVATHGDSPAFKIKEYPEIEKAGHYVELNIEKYGGSPNGLWFDRPLGIAGRVCTYADGVIRTVLVDSASDLVLIPSLAIHMDRQEEAAKHISVQKQMLPLFGEETAAGKFDDLIAGLAGVKRQDIISTDLFVYSRTPYSIWGAGKEYFSSPRLDNQQCAYASLRALISTREQDFSGQSGMPVCCIFDNEEVGSRSTRGADSTFLSDVLKRISCCMEISPQEHVKLLVSSFMLSADNSHAMHPAFPDKADPVNRPFMNGGVVLKWSAAQKYTTDAVSAALFRAICRNAGIPVQTFSNHADVPGGSTLGNILLGQVSVNCADIGCAQLAMHSPYETAGIRDTQYMMQAMEAFWNSHPKVEKDRSILL